MEFRDLLLKRRSYRSFTGGTMTKSQLDYILTAATRAPNACNMQSWHFTAVCGAEAVAKSYPAFFEDYKNQYGKTYLEDFDFIKNQGLRRAQIMWKLATHTEPSSSGEIAQENRISGAMYRNEHGWSLVLYGMRRGQL